MLMAGSLTMALPAILPLFFAQKWFIQGITLTGLKGQWGSGEQYQDCTGDAMYQEFRRRD